PPPPESGTERVRGVGAEYAQRPEAAVGPLSKDLDRLATGTSEQRPRLLGEIEDLATLPRGRPQAPRSSAGDGNCIDPRRHSSSPGIRGDQPCEPSAYVGERFGRRHRPPGRRARLLAYQRTELS